MEQTEVIVIGAGAAGLTAAADLAHAGVRVFVLEARNRVGGRIHTIRVDGVPIEFGAEFIHGRPPEIWDIIRGEGLKTYEVEGDDWCSQNGELSHCSHFAAVDQIFAEMKSRRRDISFCDYLRHFAERNPSTPKSTLRWAAQYIEGFQAAEIERISVNALVAETKAEERIDGDRAWRLHDGYASLIDVLHSRLKRENCRVFLNTAVSALRWRHHSVEVHTNAGTFTAPRSVVTLPLGVLKQVSAGEGVAFEPALEQKHRALAMLHSGAVIRVTIAFASRFWEQIRTDSGTLHKLSFLFSQDRHFPTWWTLHPRSAQVITAWAAGPAGLLLSERPHEGIFSQAIDTLASLLGVAKDEIKKLVTSWHVHNWQKDVYSHGGYSYVGVGGEGAQKELAQPVADTLFFAGEATEWQGHHATVHGAISTGHRAAREVLDSIRR